MYETIFKPEIENITTTYKSGTVLVQDAGDQVGDQEEVPITIWKSLVAQHEKEMQEVQEYKQKKKTACVVPHNPLVQFMEDNVFNLLCQIIEDTCLKAVNTESLRFTKSPFNGIDYIAELLWNRNSLYPERLEKNLFIHDMEWAQKIMEENPRPYFPLSWIFTKEIAVIKIQAFMRGYWVRRRDDVQEMRIFWRQYKREMELQDYEDKEEIITANESCNLK